jgi:hypothetical protein
MAVEAVKACLVPGFPDQADGVSPSTVRLVAVYVADVVNGRHNWQFYGALTTIAGDLGLAVRTVRRAIAHLIEVGVIELIEERPGRTTLYRWVHALPRPVQTGGPVYLDRGTPVSAGLRTQERTQLRSINLRDIVTEGHPYDCEGGCDGTGWVEVGNKVVDRCAGRRQSATLPA